MTHKWFVVVVWFVTIGVILLSVSKSIRGQPLSRFEVAVIRPTMAPTTTGTSFDLFEGGRIKITNEPVRLLIRVGSGPGTCHIIMRVPRFRIQK